MFFFWGHSVPGIDMDKPADWASVKLLDPSNRPNNQSTCPVDDCPDTHIDIEECRGAFKLFDKNRDGFISTRELLTVLRSLGQDPSDDYIKELLNQYDKDGDGKIAFDEFLEVVEILQQDTETEDELGEIFNVIDVDGDGEISKSDLRQVAHKLRSSLLTQQLDEMIDEFDKDGDGTLDFEEFKKIIVSRT